MKKYILVLVITLKGLMGQNAHAQDLKETLNQLDQLTKNVKDSTKTELPYHKVITAKAIVKKGLMTLAQVGDKYYLQIPPSMLGRDILIVNRIAKGAADKTDKTYAGDQISGQIIRLSLSHNRKNIQVSKLSFNVQGLKPGDDMYENVMRSNAQPITYIWPVKTTAPDSSKVVEITELLNGDGPLIAFDPKEKGGAGLGGLVSSNSYIEGVYAFPQNLTFKTVKTYSGSSGGGLLGGVLSIIPGMGNKSGDSKFTYGLNSSWVLLPEKPMRMREYDERVGYFYNYFVDYGSDPHGVRGRGMATRWRLAPKPQDVQRYLAGELVEPAKPIVFYIDPTTPEKWIPYLIQGVNDWQKAFEKAGFKNAIMAKRAPTKEQDSTWSLDDARYSAIVYKPSPIPNASGPHVSDPRSGEILESHINWYHNVMTILQSWYVAQVGATDPRARKNTIDDSLMGELIRFVSSHEVGHTLGLRHNFLASSSTPVALLRNKAWVEEHGHTASIMDYARFNYVAQPEDNIGPAGLFPRINDYDEWAINWGYRWFGELDWQQEKEKLSQMTTLAVKNPRLRWGATAELPGIPDPRAQIEDLGDNQMKANTYGMKNLQYVALHLPEWTIEKGKDYEKLQLTYTRGVVTQYMMYIRHALTYIGGLYNDNTGADDGAPNRYTPAPVALQKEALDFIDRWALHKQQWLFYNENINGKMINPLRNNLQPKLLEQFLDPLLSGKTLLQMVRLNDRYGDKSYQLINYMNDLQDRIWAELKGKESIEPLRQEVQNRYIHKLADLIRPIPPSPLDMLKPLLGPILGMLSSEKVDVSDTNIKAVAITMLEQLRAKINQAIKSGKFTRPLTRAHLRSAVRNINEILEERNK